LADVAADWQTAVFRKFKIQSIGVADNDFLVAREPNIDGA